jgi:LysM repeat protein
VGSLASLDTGAGAAALPSGASLLFGALVQAVSGSGVLITNGFESPVTITLTLGANEVPAGTPTSVLTLAFWNGTEWLSVPATFTLEDDGSVTATTLVEHFTVFAIIRDPLKLVKAATPSAPSAASWSGALATSGFSLMVWQGAATPIALAITALDPKPVAVWAQASGAERFLTYVPGAPAVVNDLVNVTTGQAVIMRTGATGNTPSPGTPATNAPGTPDAMPAPAPVTYTVEAADTLSEIGERFGVPWEQIAEANNIAAPYPIRLGQVLTIPTR